MVRSIVVIGSGAAGLTAASTARAMDSDARITVFTEDEDVAYSPCVIPWVLEGKMGWNDITMHTPDFYKREKGIDIQTRTTVTEVNDTEGFVEADGKRCPFDSLVIATGGKVFVPPIPGTDLKGVHILRTINDGKAIESNLKGSKKVAIAGAGVIGLELALALVSIGKDVLVIEMMDQVIPRIADKDMADRMQSYLEGKGVRFLMKAPIQSVEGDGRVEGVVAGDARYDCDMVIFATGVRANVDIAKGLGYDLGQLGGVMVSPTLQPYKRGRLVPNVFFAGDVIQCESAVMPGPTMSQLGSSAVKQGRVAGANATGRKEIFGPVASPWISIIGDMHIAGTGLSSGLASWYGIDAVTYRQTGLTRARYYPGAKELTVKLIGDRTTHRIIGAQIISGEDAVGRINWLTAAIVDGATAEDFLARAENAYCPPASMVRDVVLNAVEGLCRELKK